MNPKKSIAFILCSLIFASSASASQKFVFKSKEAKTISSIFSSGKKAVISTRRPSLKLNWNRPLSWRGLGLLAAGGAALAMAACSDDDSNNGWVPNSCAKKIFVTNMNTNVNLDVYVNDVYQNTVSPQNTGMVCWPDGIRNLTVKRDGQIIYTETVQFPSYFNNVEEAQPRYVWDTSRPYTNSYPSCGTLTVTNSAGLQDVNIFIDGAFQGFQANGTSAIYPINQGTHLIQAINTNGQFTHFRGLSYYGCQDYSVNVEWHTYY